MLLLDIPAKTYGIKFLCLLFHKSFLLEFGVFGKDRETINWESARLDRETVQGGSNASPSKMVVSLEQLYITGQEQKRKMKLRRGSSNSEESPKFQMTTSL